ncbi:MAG TPA: hypothetical protein VME01_11870 [Solirubrobacteraceae bacterium]|nr:hypothetical protein [Solirubrobacteraceae bacterium]
MKLLLGVIAVLLAAPTVAIVAIMAGPVAVLLLCIVGFGLVAFVALTGLAELGRSARAAQRRLHPRR